jgi:hypothetical protein
VGEFVCVPDELERQERPDNEVDDRIKMWELVGKFRFGGTCKPLRTILEWRRRPYCARLTPPLGLDAQAAYAAALRLALARREREHRPEHLALALIALDPGVAWVLKTANVDRKAVLADLAATFPPPRHNPLLTAERRLALPARHRDLVRRYQRTTGRAVTSADALPALIRG